jgi:AcrR family transcriptional regulator
MSTRLSRPESQARTRLRLVNAAKAAFRRDGFHRASAESIAAEAGFTRGALHANFDGKEGLFLAVLDEEIDLRQSALSPAADAKTMARRYRRLLDGDREWTLALLEFTIHAARHPALAEKLRARNETVREMTIGFISELAPETSAKDARVGAKLVMAVHSGVALERALDREGAGDAQLELAYRTVLGG